MVAKDEYLAGSALMMSIQASVDRAHIDWRLVYGGFGAEPGEVSLRGIPVEDRQNRRFTGIICGNQKEERQNAIADTYICATLFTDGMAFRLRLDSGAGEWRITWGERI
jgi:hypothetical protein